MVPEKGYKDQPGKKDTGKNNKTIMLLSILDNKGEHF